MSGLTKKTVIADGTLSVILGVNEGELVSYAELSKGLHKYIKDHDLRNPQLRQPSTLTLQPAPTMQPAQPSVVPQIQPAAAPAVKKCRDCRADIPADAVFCDLCGFRQ